MVQPFFATPPAALSFFTRAAECVDAGVNIARDVPARFSDNLEIFTWLRILHLIRLVFATSVLPDGFLPRALLFRSEGRLIAEEIRTEADGFASDLKKPCGLSPEPVIGWPRIQSGGSSDVSRSTAGIVVFATGR